MFNVFKRNAGYCKKNMEKERDNESFGAQSKEFYQKIYCNKFHLGDTVNIPKKLIDTDFDATGIVEQICDNYISIRLYNYKYCISINLLDAISMVQVVSYANMDYDVTDKTMTYTKLLKQLNS